MANDTATLSAELERLYQRQADLRAYEVALADRGENDPASDTWKTAAIVAASAEADFQSALVRNWNTIARLLKEGEQWRARESETQEALQAIGEEFGVRGGEPRVDGIRRVLVEQRDTISRVLREAAEGWIKITSADDLPKKPGLKHYEYVDCLIFHKGEIKKRPWNCEHLCWDDEEYDDFYCDALEPTYYMRLPPPPATETTNSQEPRHD